MLPGALAVVCAADRANMEQESSVAGETNPVYLEMGFVVIDLGWIAPALLIDTDRIMKGPSPDIRHVGAGACWRVPMDRRRFGRGCHSELLVARLANVDESHTDTPAALSNRGWICRCVVQRAVQMAIRQPVRSLAKRTLRASRPMAVAKW